MNMIANTQLSAAQPEAAACGRTEAFFRRMPKHVCESLTEEQRNAIAEAVRQSWWSNHLVNLRFSLPLIFKRYYLVLLAGEERRSKERLREERSLHPISTLPNILFLLILVSIGTILGSFVSMHIFLWILGS